MTTTYITTAIPFVNAAPHLGHGLELVLVDAVARAWRAEGRAVRTSTGTDENASKNVEAAAAAGVPVEELVARNADAFAALAVALDARFDDFIRTASDPRHRLGVEHLWRRWRAAGDLYQADYEGDYCTGCEAYLGADDLVDGRCPEHLVAPTRIVERNWFFRLSRYAGQIAAAIERDEYRIVPASRRNEVLSVLAAGVDDISVSRAAARTAGWGIPVPDDPDQVIYVWIDALANYITALDVADRDRVPTDPGSGALGRWWLGADERIHVIGKGIIRFHALYWPALLLSADLPLPTQLWVHDYFTADGQKVSKSLGGAVAADELVESFGSDSLRWWLLRHLPRGADVDFRADALVADVNADLANTIGNLVSRVVTLLHKVGDGAVDADALARATSPSASPIVPAERVHGQVLTALDGFDTATATRCVVDAAATINRFLDQQRPWESGARDPALLPVADVLAQALVACRALPPLVEPFAPTLASRLATQLGVGAAVGARGAAFPRLAVATV